MPAHPRQGNGEVNSPNEANYLYLSNICVVIVIVQVRTIVVATENDDARAKARATRSTTNAAPDARRHPEHHRNERQYRCAFENWSRNARQSRATAQRRRAHVASLVEHRRSRSLQENRINLVRIVEWNHTNDQVID